MKLVQLMGGAPMSNMVGPKPAGAERWGMNAHHASNMLRQRLKGWTRWFDLHSTEHIKGRKYNVYAWECQQAKPVYRWTVDPAMPSSVAYPREAQQGSRLFTSTLDWLMALAIYEQFTHIELYGFRMGNEKYAYQIPAARWWIQQARHLGIDVTVVGPIALKRTPKGPPSKIVVPDSCLMYGLETTDRSKLYHAK